MGTGKGHFCHLNADDQHADTWPLVALTLAFLRACFPPHYLALWVYKAAPQSKADESQCCLRPRHGGETDWRNRKEQTLE